MENLNGTLENNKLIAEFMGLIVLKEKEIISWEDLNITTHSISEFQRYHAEWNWLMPVVEKIESLNITPLYGKEWIRFSVNIEYDFCKIEHLKITGSKIIAISTSECNSKLQATYKAVIEFIKWYNLNK